MKKISKKQLADTALKGSRDFYADASFSDKEVRTHDELLKANLFKKIDAFTFVERLLTDEIIKGQSKDIAEKLLSHGYDPYLPTDNQVSMIGLVSGAVFRLSPYRNINLIPEVAQRNRQPLLQEFDLFLKEHPKIKRYARYMVVTSGERFPIYQFEDRLKAFNKQLGRYFEISSNNSIDVILCSIEFTLNEDNLVNLHANIVSAPRKAFGPNGWSDWLSLTRKHFKNQILKDCGRVQDTKEIIKYVCKYNEISNLSSSWLVELAQALFKKQLVRPLGLFREFRKELKERGQKVRFDNEEKDLVRCQVSKRNKPETKEDFVKEDIENEMAAQDAAIRKAISGRYEQRDEKEPVQNQIICKTLPQSRATLNGEPFVVVMNYEANPLTKNGKDGLECIEARREFHFRLFAENGIYEDDLSDVGAKSKLDTLTIIPNSFIHEYMSTSSKRRQKINSLLGITSNDDLEDIKIAVVDALNAHFPKEFHNWSYDVSDPVKLIEKGRKHHEEWLANKERSKELYQEYLDSKDDFYDSNIHDENNFDSLLYNFDELDFAIPY